MSDLHLRTVIEQSPLATIIFAPDGRCLLVNAAWRELWDLENGEVLQEGSSVFESNEIRFTGLSPFLRESMDDGRIVTPLLHYEPDTSISEAKLRWLRAIIYPVRRRDGGLLEVGLMLEDLTEHHTLEVRLTQQAFHDSLTGLPNRALLKERLEHSLNRLRQKAEREDSVTGKVRAVALLFIDIDNFKRINDSLGHPAGDRLLVQIAERLGPQLRPGDTFARFGGDEFAVLLDDVEDTVSAMGLAERLVRELRVPFVVEGHEIFVTASIGVVLNDAVEEGGGEDLLRRADIAMYQGKRAGRDRVALFSQDLRVSDLRHMRLNGDLHRAIEAGDLRLYYQPKMLLRTGSIVGFEALVRWEHPECGLLSPMEFIPLAEQSGLIVPLGRWVLAEACRQAHIFRKHIPSGAPMRVFVNLSSRQFRHPTLVKEVARVLSESGLSPSDLGLEITETMMMESQRTSQTILAQLRELGVALAVDDFGTGHSSLAFLKRFPVDVLKIDRSMVAGVDESSVDSEIILAIVTLAHALGLTVVAEGVETAEELETLLSLGCDFGQGYYWREPCAAGEAMQLLAGWSGL